MVPQDNVNFITEVVLQTSLSTVSVSEHILSASEQENSILYFSIN
ncbi:hypothetical protein Halhy_3844 [Haliscomenobacter hydrossis DSM 1100]|uniref:Uncharacterized protein n=1 Tax=Haliscomenobacter hydrossis (strain ATCC 27775 / DSM 1100 / LMG 10767 / O) TaxID=760192 RepID=F4L289_HALH1|nr:hypothetical protein Halhy_3844 [Haliscomenobacter hydrossis DSM 1100]